MNLFRHASIISAHCAIVATHTIITNIPMLKIWICFRRTTNGPTLYLRPCVWGHECILSLPIMQSLFSLPAHTVFSKLRLLHYAQTEFYGVCCLFRRTDSWVSPAGL